MIFNPCITIDISQDRSHVQGFTAFNCPCSKAKTFEHTKPGFAMITELFEKIKEETKLEPLIVFEYTGIYHLTVQKFLDSKDYKYHIVAPLRAAKTRQNDLRGTKTDKRDCLSLAKTYYTNEHGVYNTQSEVYEELRSLNRFYERVNLHEQEIKVNLRELLATIYPCYEISKKKPIGAFKNVYTDESLSFLENYPHPNLFLDESFENFEKKFKCSKIRKNQTLDIFNRLKDYVKNIIPGCTSDSCKVYELLLAIKHIAEYEEAKKEIVDKLDELASKASFYEQIKTLSCVKKNLSCRLLAELGDMKKYNSFKAIIAMAGTDPNVRASGDNDGLHLKITKKGNKHLRTILFLICQQMVKCSSIDTPIRRFYIKKTQQGLNHLVALTACCNKLILILYQMYKNGTTFAS